MHFESMQARHATPHHHHVGTSLLVHPLNDFVVCVSVVKVILVNWQAPRMRQTTDHRHPCYSIHGATLNLDEKVRAITIERETIYLEHARLNEVIKLSVLKQIV